MDVIPVSNTLPSEDHRAALEIINQLGGCRTRARFSHLLKTLVIPLLGSSGVVYAHLEGKHSTPRVLDAFYPSSLCQSQWRSFLKIARQSHLVGSSSATEMISTLAIKGFHCNDPVSPHRSTDLSNSSQKGHSCCAVAVLFDSVSPAVALYLCRFSAQPHHYSLREIKLMRLLCATLLQTVKAIAFCEESQNLKLILNCISGRTEPLAVVRKNGYLIYKNYAFDQVMGQSGCAPLSIFLSSRNLVKLDQTVCHFSRSRLGRRLYEVDLTPLDAPTYGKTSLYLLRFTRVTDKNRRTIRQLAKVGLTSRELEIAALIHQGISPQNIADQLNVSYHTVRNHLKHIYCKIGVSTRGEMMTWCG